MFPVYIFTPQVNYPFNFCYNFLFHLMVIFHQICIAPQSNSGCGREENNKVSCFFTSAS